MIEEITNLHIVPNEDEWEHECSEDCWCKPRQDPVYANIFVHNLSEDLTHLNLTPEELH